MLDDSPFIQQDSSTTSSPRSRRGGCSRVLIWGGLLGAFFVTVLVVSTLFHTLRSSSRGDDDGWKEPPHGAVDPICGRFGIFQTDIQECFCYDCWRGPKCEEVIPEANCTLTKLESGLLLIHSEFWQRTTADMAPGNRISAAGGARIPVDYRIPYQSPDPEDPHTVHFRLAEEIRRTHELIGNAETSGRSVVFGHGAVQLLQAAWAALAGELRQQIQVYSRQPHYNRIPQLSNMNPRYSKFVGDPEDADPGKTVEILTHPNNPDGKPQRIPDIQDSFAVMNDLVYYWPHVCGEETCPGGAMEMLDDDIMIFSMSKFTGHAGTRLGWALVKDPETAEAMRNWIKDAVSHVSVDAQFRSLEILKALNRDDGKLLHRFLHDTKAEIADRWERLNATLAMQPSGKTVLELHSSPNFVYAWIKCNERIDSCVDTFRSYGMRVVDGGTFGSESAEFVRVNLPCFSPEFEVLLQKITRLLNQEGDKLFGGPRESALRSRITE